MSTAEFFPFFQKLFSHSDLLNVSVFYTVFLEELWKMNIHLPGGFPQPGACVAAGAGSRQLWQPRLRRSGWDQATVAMPPWYKRQGYGAAAARPPALPDVGQLHLPVSVG